MYSLRSHISHANDLTVSTIYFSVTQSRKDNCRIIRRPLCCIRNEHPLKISVTNCIEPSRENSNSMLTSGGIIVYQMINYFPFLFSDLQWSCLGFIGEASAAESGHRACLERRGCGPNCQESLRFCLHRVFLCIVCTRGA